MEGGERYDVLTIMSVAWLGADLARTNGSRRIQGEHDYDYVDGTGRQRV